MSIEENKKLIEALVHSNWIENEYSLQALKQSIEAFEYLNNVKINTTTIQECHRILLNGMLKKDLGVYRSCGIRIGGEIKSNIGPKKINDLINKWCDNWICGDGNMAYEMGEDYTWEYIKKAHIEFENIHPFIDGNGRIGRIIMNTQALGQNLEPMVITIGEEQNVYYKWFRDKENDIKKMVDKLYKADLSLNRRYGEIK